MPKPPPDEFHIRVPPELAQRIRISAAESGRKINPELVALIESGLDKKNSNLVEGVKALKHALGLIEKGGG